MTAAGAMRAAPKMPIRTGAPLSDTDGMLAPDLAQFGVNAREESVPRRGAQLAAKATWLAPGPRGDEHNI